MCQVFTKYSIFSVLFALTSLSAFADGEQAGGREEADVPSHSTQNFGEFLRELGLEPTPDDTAWGMVVNLDEEGDLLSIDGPDSITRGAVLFESEELNARIQRLESANDSAQSELLRNKMKRVRTSGALGGAFVGFMLELHFKNLTGGVPLFQGFHPVIPTLFSMYLGTMIGFVFTPLVIEEFEVEESISDTLKERENFIFRLFEAGLPESESYFNLQMAAIVEGEFMPAIQENLELVDFEALHAAVDKTYQDMKAKGLKEVAREYLPRRERNQGRSKHRDFKSSEGAAIDLVYLKIKRGLYFQAALLENPEDARQGLSLTRHACDKFLKRATNAVLAL